MLLSSVSFQGSSAKDSAFTLRWAHRPTLFIGDQYTTTYSTTRVDGKGRDAMWHGNGTEWDGTVLFVGKTQFLRPASGLQASSESRRETTTEMGLVKQNGSSENLKKVVVANSNTEGKKSSRWAKKSMHFKFCNHLTSSNFPPADAGDSTPEFHQFAGGNHPKFINIHLTSSTVCHN